LTRILPDLPDKTNNREDLMAKPKIRRLAIFARDPAKGRAGMKCAGIIVGLAFALVTHVEAAEIKVISTGGARAVMTSLVPEFERKSGHKVGISFGTPGNMRDRLLQGEAADVAVAIAAILPDLEKAGKIAPGTRMEFAASYVGVVVRAGTPKLDVSTPDGVKSAVLMAKTVVLSDPKAGTQLGATFLGAADRLGFGPDLRSRTKLILGPGSDVAEAVARGEAELGVTLISEILPVTGVMLGGELPSSIMPPTVIHAFLVSGTKDPETAKVFLDFLRSPDARRMIEAKGMKPGPQ
jgi:molybdate transport system substrate-binding protein